MNTDQLKNLLRHYNLKPNFTYGQNFLIDEFVMQDIVDAAEISKNDLVLEIGPGIGNLTELLCQRAGFVLSVEKDPKFFPILKALKKEHRENFRFEIADALEFDYMQAFSSQQLAFSQTDSGGLAEGYPLNAKSYKVVANIPYYITGKILQMFMTAKHKPTTITILTQKEVARNLSAQPGSLSILAISVQLYGEPKLMQVVPAKSFYPAPKVDSAIIQIKLFNEPRYAIPDEKKFFSIVKACFSGKRKQIHNTLKNNLHLDEETVKKILTEANINPVARPQELSIEEWISLSNLVTSVSPKKLT